MNIYNYFENSTRRDPHSDALFVDGVTYSYSQLRDVILRISWSLKNTSCRNVGLYAYRSLSAYAGLLSSLHSGKAYVPLNLKFQVKRNLQIINLAEISVFIIDPRSINDFVVISEFLENGLTLIFPENGREDIPKILLENHQVITQDLMKAGNEEPVNLSAEDLAYIMFTSGSTGVPKGVPVSHGNVNSYISYQKNRYDFRPGDRFSQTFDLTFDPSVHDIFMCFEAGSSLYCVPETDVMAPAKFINQHELTVWYSVPSIAQFMHRFKMLKQNRFPHLRYSIFAGEALPKNIAEAWQISAPNSELENLYGPTEATISITHYRLPKSPDQIKEVNGIVSIGDIFQSQQYCLIDHNKQIVQDEGELCVSGSLVTRGYLNNPEKTKQQYITIHGKDGIWYRTGDLVREEDGLLFYLSRIDFQVKIRGYRVELDEVNLAISKITGASFVCSLPHPVENGVAKSIVSFVDRQHEIDEGELLNKLSSELPEYMVPKKINFVDNIPLNVNGKIDRKSLIKLIE